MYVNVTFYIYFFIINKQCIFKLLGISCMKIVLTALVRLRTTCGFCRPLTRIAHELSTLCNTYLLNPIYSNKMILHFFKRAWYGCTEYLLCICINIKNINSELAVKKFLLWRWCIPKLLLWYLRLYSLHITLIINIKYLSIHVYN